MIAYPSLSRPSASGSIIGAWRLERCELVDARGTLILPFGASPQGLLIYEASGAMSVAIMREGRAGVAANDILRSTTDGFMSYAGFWELELDERHELRCVIHRVVVSLSPNWAGTMQRRLATLEGDSLLLSTERGSLGSESCVARLRWHRHA